MDVISKETDGFHWTRLNTERFCGNTAEVLDTAVLL
jgi:hypothetical protein